MKFDRETDFVFQSTVMERQSAIMAKVDNHAAASARRDDTLLRVMDKTHRAVSNITQESKPVSSVLELPVDLPVMSLTMEPNEDFVGRENELEQLHRYLIDESSDSGQPKSCVLLGIGGIGKTEIALEFAYKYKDHWDAGVFWVTADTTQETELERTFCDIGRTLGIVDASENDERQVARVKYWLENKSKHAPGSLGPPVPSFTFLG